MLQQRLHDMEAKGILANINGQESKRMEVAIVPEIDDDEDIDGDEEPVVEVLQTIQQSDRVYTLYEDF